MRLDPKWIETFADGFRLRGVQLGDACDVLSEMPSRTVNVRLSERALASPGGALLPPRAAHDEADGAGPRIRTRSTRSRPACTSPDPPPR